MTLDNTKTNPEINQIQSTLKLDTEHQLITAIQTYESALNAVNQEQQKCPETTILNLLVARDSLAQVLSEKTLISAQYLMQIIQLDNRLREHTEIIVKTGNLKQWQASFNPPSQAWWWFLEIPNKKAENDNSLDVIFDILTLVSLTGTTSFLITFSNLFIAGGLSVLETFGLMGQGGLLIAAMGTFKGKGREIIRAFLQKKGVPRQFHSQVTFGVSALLFLTSLSIYNLLPKLGNIYFQEGKEAYQKGLLIPAENKYQQALNITPDNPEINVALGEVYESTGNIKAAK